MCKIIKNRSSGHALKVLIKPRPTETFSMNIFVHAVAFAHSHVICAGKPVTVVHHWNVLHILKDGRT